MTFRSSPAMENFTEKVSSLLLQYFPLVWLRVVYSRWCCLSARRVSFQLFPIAKETGFLPLRQGAVAHCISSEKQLGRCLALSCVVSYQGRLALARVASESLGK